MAGVVVWILVAYIARITLAHNKHLHGFGWNLTLFTFGILFMLGL